MKISPNVGLIFILHKLDRGRRSAPRAIHRQRASLPGFHGWYSSVIRMFSSLILGIVIVFVDTHYRKNRIRTAVRPNESPIHLEVRRGEYFKSLLSLDVRVLVDRVSFKELGGSLWCLERKPAHATPLGKD